MLESCNVAIQLRAFDKDLSVNCNCGRLGIPSIMWGIR